MLQSDTKGTNNLTVNKSLYLVAWPLLAYTDEWFAPHRMAHFCSWSLLWTEDCDIFTPVLWRSLVSLTDIFGVFFTAMFHNVFVIDSCFLGRPAWCLLPSSLLLVQDTPYCCAGYAKCLSSGADWLIFFSQLQNGTFFSHRQLSPLHFGLATFTRNTVFIG